MSTDDELLWAFPLRPEGIDDIGKVHPSATLTDAASNDPPNMQQASETDEDFRMEIAVLVKDPR